ncbi:MAG: tetratricopeptide repeat protein [Candidatus Omnitrophica bacterium]|nr:tetratricopeptide repeat protein [Candidatus Omnitrophota bacterium]
MHWRASAFRKGAGGLACLALVWAVSGCSASYRGERLFWRAQQLSAPIVKDPGRVEPAQVAQAIEAFRRVTQAVPGTVWGARAQMAIGSLNALRRDYREARAAYAGVLREYHEEQELCLNARVAIAKSYEIEQQWAEAAAAYYDVTDYHLWSRLGLEVPLYVAALYAKSGTPDQATRAYERAVGIYTKAIPNAPTPELVTQVKGYLAIAYQRLGDWDHETELLEELASTQTGVNRPLVLLTLGSIYQAKLSNHQRAEQTFTQLFEEFPDHLYGHMAKLKLEQLGLTIIPQSPSDAPPPSP